MIRAVVAACSAVILLGVLARAHVDTPHRQPHEAESHQPHETISRRPHEAISHSKPQKAPKHGTAHPATHPKVAKH